ncbi:MAG TPA: MOSC domain-containing protein [Acidimicrobiales bacterium]|nr:MOSC domain-containing protein [Acidimicrobiales bacterium]
MQPDPRWTVQDLAGTARAAGVWWDLLVAGVEPLPPGLAAAQDRIATLTRTVAADVPVAERAPAATDLVRALSEAGRAVHAAGGGPGPHAGRVVGVHVSQGGVPKVPVASAAVGWRGLDGDRQATRRHHGRVWQAVCLWSAEVIDRLAGEGHPIFPGAAGENVTVAEVDWAALRPGTRLRLGAAEGGAVVEVTLPALPCTKNARRFAGGDVDRMHHERHPGDSRLYALVVTPGSVAVGDEVAVEP